MNTKLNKSDWILLAIIYGITIILNGIDYYRTSHAFIEYIIDFPVYIIISLSVIILFLRKLIPEFLIYNKDMNVLILEDEIPAYNKLVSYLEYLFSIEVQHDWARSN